MKTRIITKEKFCNLIHRIEEVHEWENKLDDLLGCTVDSQTLEYELIDVLMDMFGDSEEYSDICYFIYDLDFGKEYKPDCITIDGENLDISTAEKLYDYLVRDN